MTSRRARPRPPAGTRARSQPSKRAQPRTTRGTGRAHLPVRHATRGSRPADGPAHQPAPRGRAGNRLPGHGPCHGPGERAHPRRTRAPAERTRTPLENARDGTHASPGSPRVPRIMSRWTRHVPATGIPRPDHRRAPRERTLQPGERTPPRRTRTNPENARNRTRASSQLVRVPRITTSGHGPDPPCGNPGPGLAADSPSQADRRLPQPGHSHGDSVAAGVPGDRPGERAPPRSTRTNPENARGATSSARPADHDRRAGPVHQPAASPGRPNARRPGERRQTRRTRATERARRHNQRAIRGSRSTDGHVRPNSNTLLVPAAGVTTADPRERAHPRRTRTSAENARD